MANEKNYFKLFASCIPVKGSVRAGICDLQRETFDAMPVGLFDILDTCKNAQYSTILSKYGEENKETINEFFDWLIKKRFGFWCKSEKEAMQFSEMNLEWDNPFEISNIIIDLDPNSTIDYHKIFKEIIVSGIPFIQLRCYSFVNIDFYVSLLNICEGSRIKTIDIVTPYIVGLTDEKLKEICRKYLLINSITFHDAPIDEHINLLDGLTQLIYSKERINNHKCCGKISSSHFTINTMLFTESQQNNTCLNRKISIDVNGEIKNCPSMKERFGNIENATFQEILNKKEFKKYWNINKDKIAVCKDCEFRHICTDCRAYIENPEDIYSKPLKCGYNPYTAEWEEWSTNPMKQKAIEYYNLRDLIKLE
jgi:SPASM domain peptide maturase of grasp-with-spasm system